MRLSEWTIKVCHCFGWAHFNEVSGFGPKNLGQPSLPTFNLFIPHTRKLLLPRWICQSIDRRSSSLFKSLMKLRNDFFISRLVNPPNYLMMDVGKSKTWASLRWCQTWIKILFVILWVSVVKFRDRYDVKFFLHHWNRTKVVESES